MLWRFDNMGGFDMLKRCDTFNSLISLIDMTNLVDLKHVGDFDMTLCEHMGISRV